MLVCAEKICLRFAALFFRVFKQRFLSQNKTHKLSLRRKNHALMEKNSTHRHKLDSSRPSSALAPPFCIAAVHT